MRPERGYSRIDVERRGSDGWWKSQHGWYARVMRNGVKHSKWFSDHGYGGKRRAQRAASEWVREKREELGEPAINVDRLGKKLVRNGYPCGVSRRTDAQGRDAFYAYARDANGRVLKTSFSCKKHGVAGARALAVARREKWIRNLERARRTG